MSRSLTVPLFIAAICGILHLQSCSTHEAIASLEPDGACWSIHDTLELSFQATDTTQAYKLYFPSRFTEDYPYNNLYVRLITITPSGQSSDNAYRFQLMDELGNWFGEPRGTGAVVENMLGNGVKFSEKGEYTLKLYHFMRDLDLCGVSEAAIAIDKIN